MVEESTAFLDIALNADRFFHIQQNKSCFFCRRLRSYNPATCMNSLKYSFQITNTHITQQKHSSSFLTRLRWNQRKKKEEKKRKKQSTMFMQFPSKGADSWLNPEASWADCRWSTLLSPPSPTAINQNHYRDTGQRKVDGFKTKRQKTLFSFSVY